MVSELRNQSVWIEQYFACSRTALLLRLDGIGLIDYKKYEQYTRNVKHSAAILGYDTSLYDKGNEGLVIGDYGAKAKKLFDVGKISESQYPKRFVMLDKVKNELCMTPIHPFGE